MEIDESKFTIPFMKRIQNRLKDIDFKEIGVSHFYLAGNSLNAGLPNDLDLFPADNKDDFKNINWKAKAKGIKVVSKTNNATTVRVSGKTLQFCNYWHTSLKDLVESFDFAHIKIGAEVTVDAMEDVVAVDNIYLSPDFVLARTTGKTFFTGSEYPLSSLVRLSKYHKRGDLILGNQFIFECIGILVAIIERGFKNYGDFKNQLDAVDLGLLPEELEEFKNKEGNLNKLFDLLEDKLSFPKVEK